MTDRLYYHDSFLREFGAQVLACEPAGDRWQVQLDRTAFYPTSGGQPHDTGKLGDAAILDVLERDDLEIVHVTDRALPASSVHASIDWERRFDHMQQHSGQHLLSAAFLELFKFPTVSFHLGREISTIDLAARSLVPRHLEEAERLANQVIFEDRPVTVSFGTAMELADAGIRKAVEREGLLRVIEIEGFDRQPCGGTHVTRTGQVGLLLLRKLEKIKQNWRVEFACGFRALRIARADFATLGEAAQQLSCGLPDVPAMVKKTLEERQASHRVRQRLFERLAESEARAVLAATQPSGASATRVVTRVFDDADPAYLRLLAARIVAEPKAQVLLATRAGGHVVFAQSPGLAADMNALLRETLAASGGKGGGSKDFAQGTVPESTTLEALLSQTAQRLQL